MSKPHGGEELTWLAGLRERAQAVFPERQVHFRTDGRVAYFRLTTLSQVIASAALVAALGWTGFSSYSYVEHDKVVAVKDGQIGLQIEEAFDFTALPLNARVGPELASARTRFPEAEIWLTKGAHITGGDTDVAMRAFIPATRVAEELVSELSDAIYCMVVDVSGTSFALSASASPSI